MIIFVLVSVIAFLSCLQSEKRRMTAFVFTLLTALHTFAWGVEPEDGNLYYLTAAITDVLIMTVISNLKYTTKLTENLLKISLCFAILNSTSWVLWMGRIDTDIVIYAAIGLYVATIVSLLNWDGVEDGNYTLDNRLDFFRFDSLERLLYFKKIQKETRG